jgi:rhodanese-related sulfurtransferase
VDLNCRYRPRLFRSPYHGRSTLFSDHQRRELGKLGRYHCVELVARLDRLRLAHSSSGKRQSLLDVRNDDEFARARIEGSTLIPLDQLEARVDELAAWKSGRIVVLCHVGGRSKKACSLLMEYGFEGVENLEGGIDAWALTVDPSIARYS